MSMMRSYFQRFLFPGLRGVIDTAFREKPLQYTQLFRVESSSAAFEEFRTWAGSGLFVRTPENVEISYDRFYDGFPKRFNHEDYTLGVGFSHQFMRDIKMQIAKERARQLGISARSTMEILNADLLNSAFDAGSPGPDGVALISASHPNERGGTQSNLISPIGTLSVTTVRSLLTKARRFYDGTGVRRIQLAMEKLVVPPELEFQAMEILQSAGRPDTADRADNVIRGRLSLFVYDYLESPKFFYGLASKSDHYLYVFDRERFGTREWETEENQTMWMGARFAQSRGWPHWMGVIGSNPA